METNNTWRMLSPVSELNKEVGMIPRIKEVKECSFDAST
jgi:hypothetical protein